MKKIKTLTFLIALMVMGTVKPAPALMIDGSQIAAKVSDWVQKITDAANKISQQAMQGKLMTSQGFNFSGLIDVNQLLSNLQQSLVNQSVDKQMNQVVEGTKEKNRQAVAAQKNAYGEAAKEQYSQKLAYTADNVDKTKEKQNEYQNEATQKCQQKEQAKSDYENETNPEEKSKKFEKYTNLVAECEDYQTKAKEASLLLVQLQQEQKEMQKTASIVGTDKDVTYHELKLREEALSNQEEIKDFYGVDSGSDTEWDSENLAKAFQLEDKAYKEFFERYFYNPQQISKKSGANSSDNRLAYQSTMDRVMRERRYLVVNSAAHLMQVSATVRREIPVRTASIEKVFKNVPSSTGELEAMLSYAATRVENARTLLLYAKLLSAKIQYMAAADLLGIEPKKTWKDNEDYSQFDLGRYILTEEYVKELAEEYNKTLDFKEGK
ncbi:MAG: hypothetical protein J6C85_04285 [Alphaproteobacteria bacterium]|nr:hypothetical protein [Alphaproteobacteria bacterium]